MENINLQELILNGKKHVEEIETEIGIFRVCPLDIGERARVKARAMGGLKTTAKMEQGKPVEAAIAVDLDKMEEAENESKIMVIGFGLSLPGERKISIDDVKKLVLPDKIFNKIYQTICRISGLDMDSLTSFRGITTGTGIVGGNMGIADTVDGNTK